VDNHKFVAFDVHAKTTTFVVLNDKGKVVAQGVTETTADGLTSLVKGISGKIHLTFEESTQAAWLHERLHRHVAKLVVCNPRKNRRRQENKNDRVDALQLARWLRSGDLSPVYHRDHGTKSLKELVRGYENVVDDRTRVKNRLKAIYRSRGLLTPGRDVYKPDERDDWLSKLDPVGLRTRAEWLHAQTESMDDLVKIAKKAVECEARRHAGCKLLKSVPGIAWIRAATIVAHVKHPDRFRTKRQFWCYCGFAVVMISSDDWEVTQTGLVRKSRPQTTRGLNKKYNRHLKAAFKGAARTACGARGILKPHFDYLVASGMRESMATLTVARKIAAASLAIWKKGEKYDLGKAVIRTE
jgi:transposase